MAPITTHIIALSLPLRVTGRSPVFIAFFCLAAAISSRVCLVRYDAQLSTTFASLRFVEKVPSFLTSYQSYDLSGMEFWQAFKEWRAARQLVALSKQGDAGAAGALSMKQALFAVTCDYRGGSHAIHEARRAALATASRETSTAALPKPSAPPEATPTPPQQYNVHARLTTLPVNNLHKHFPTDAQLASDGTAPKPYPLLWAVSIIFLLTFTLYELCRLISRLDISIMEVATLASLLLNCLTKLFWHHKDHDVPAQKFVEAESHVAGAMAVAAHVPPDVPHALYFRSSLETTAALSMFPATFLVVAAIHAPAWTHNFGTKWLHDIHVLICIASIGMVATSLTLNIIERIMRWRSRRRWVETLGMGLEAVWLAAFGVGRTALCVGFV